MRLACDTGGTFTDLLVEETDGSWLMTKASTVAEDPIQGVLAAIDKAAAIRGEPLSAFLGRADLLIHGTTHALNAVLTHRTAKTALLVTRGHRDILTLREGGRTGPFAFNLLYPAPYVPRALTFEVSERMEASGRTRQPLDAEEVLSICSRLRTEGVEAVAVCLLWSVANPVHELEIGRILAECLPGVPVTLSHAVSSSVREFRRASAASIDASLKPLMGRYLGTLSERLNAAGFAGRLLVATSQGGMLPAPNVAKMPILSINSGPSMAPVAGRWYGQKIDPDADVIVADTGGTTFDVSLVRDGQIPLTRETWIGGEHRGPMTGFSSVDIRSVGAGGGSIASITPGGLLKVGPQSAGAWPGPACYGRGGDRPTLSDAALILGVLDPARFLDGGMSLDVDAAHAAMREHVAIPLGVSVQSAAAMVVQVATETMAQAILDLLVSQGVDPHKALLLVGGGAAGLNAIFIARRLGCARLIVPEAGAALSATGAMLSDLKREVRTMQYQTTAAFDATAARAALGGLVDECKAFVSEMGVDEASLSFSAEARYPDQVWELDLPLASPDFSDSEVVAIEQDFHRLHRKIFAVSDPRSPVEIVGWSASAACSIRPKTVPRLDLAVAREDTERMLVLPDGSSMMTPVYDYAGLEQGRNYRGPALVEMPLSTVVLDRDASFTREHGSLVIGLDQ